jgi:TonB family protein
MIFFSDTQETASRFVDTIDDLHDVFRCNGIDFGSPEDFFAFARTVKYHSELRGDVLRVVKFVMESETNISFRTILTIIALASGGPDVATSDREMSGPVSLVIESLIGTGACSQLNADHPDVLCLDLTAKETAPVVGLDRSSVGGGEATGHTGVTGHEDVGEPFFEKAAGDSPIDQGPSNSYRGPSNDYGGSSTLAESLARLELNSLQLKIYLDSIDQRISRMEPRLENVPPLVLPAPTAHPREEAGARFTATIPPETEFQPAHNDPPVSNQQGRAATGPLAVLTRLWTCSRQFYSLRKRSTLLILAGVAMPLLGASFFWSLGRDTGYVVVRPVNASVEGGANGGGPAPRAVSAVSGPSVGALGESQVATVAPVRAARGNSSAPTYSYTGLGVSRPADKPTLSSKKSAQIPFSSPSPSSSSLAADAETPPVMAMDTSEIVTPPDRANRLGSEPLSNRRVNVSSGVMAANLVSGPKPSYPALASLTRTQGNVVMRALISKNGTVEGLHVIEGHRLLRGAAKSAVRTWRYRPYKIDGVPVEVATTVSVDFSLHR